MDKWQIDRINDNLVELIKNTICNAELITRLSSVLGGNDEESLSNLMPFEKSKLLYKILITRADAFNVLLKSLEETNQTGALKILKGHTPSFQHYGLIAFDEEHILGSGCCGTVVYKGIFDHRDVAVKVLNSVQINLRKALKEVEFLRKLDKHENIVRYYFAERDKNLIYIALELFEIDLQNEMKMKVVNLDPITLLRKCTAGAAFLHSKNILHRDLKPANILVSRPDIVKISDFGLSKQIPDGATSVTASGAVGTADWMAPEILNALFEDEDNEIEHIKMTSKSDIFSLGCIFYFVLSNGTHPFGKAGPKRQVNIMNDKPQLKVPIDNDMWMNLILKMISHSPKERPSSLHILEELIKGQEMPIKSNEIRNNEQDAIQNKGAALSLENKMCEVDKSNKMTFCQPSTSQNEQFDSSQNTSNPTRIEEQDATQTNDDPPSLKNQDYQVDKLKSMVDPCPEKTVTVYFDKIIIHDTSKRNDTEEKQTSSLKPGQRKMDSVAIRIRTPNQTSYHHALTSTEIQGNLTPGFKSSNPSKPSIETKIQTKNLLEKKMENSELAVTSEPDKQDYNIKDANTTSKHSGLPANSQQNTSFDYKALMLSKVKIHGRIRTLEDIGVNKDDLVDILSTGQHKQEYLKILDKENNFILTKDTFPSLPPYYIFRKIRLGNIQYTEQEFFNDTKDEKIVLICDLPGMGKSLLLSSLARRIQKTCPRRIFVYIKLPDFIEKINSLQYTENITQSQILMMAIEELSTSPFSRDILIKVIGKRKVSIFFDDFDQISIKYIPLCKQILKILGTSNVIMYVASRPSYIKDLETTFEVKSCLIVPFDHESQVEFLCNFWKHEIPVWCKQQGSIKDFAECYLKEIKNQVTTDVKENSCIAAIPSLCHQLAQVQIKSLIKQIKLHLLPVPSSIDAFGICKEYINTFIFKTDQENKDLKGIYIQKSLKLLSPEIFDVETFHQNSDDGELLLNTVNIFGEYFIAEYFARLLTGPEVTEYTEFDKKKVEFFTVKCILSFETGTSIYEINSYVNKFKNSLFLNMVSNHLAEWSANFVPGTVIQSFSNLVSPNDLYNIIISCVQNSQYVHLLGFVESVLLIMDQAYLANYRAFFIDQIPKEATDQEIEDMPRCFFILLIATKYSDVSMVRACFQLFKNCFQYNLSDAIANNGGYLTSPFDVALQKSDLEMVKFLLEKGISTKSALCDYIKRSYYDNASKIRIMLEMCKMLVNWNRDFLTEDVLFTDFVHLELIKYLVQKGANFYNVKTKQTIVHRALRYMSANDFYEICHFLVKIDRIGLSIFKSNLPKWNSPFHENIYRNDMLEKILKILDIPGIDLNEPDQDGNTLILKEAEANADPEILKQLMDHGADVNVINKDGQNALHLAAGWRNKLKMYNLETIKFLVSVGVDVNARDENGKTPTQLAEDGYKTCKSLALRGGYFAKFNGSELQKILDFLKTIVPNLSVAQK